MLDGVLNETQLRKIEANLKARAEGLSKEKFEEMEELLNDIIYQQMKKIRVHSAFIREFEGIYELQQQELLTMKEECIAERIAITKFKTVINAGKTDPEHKVFAENEFAVSHSVDQIELPQNN